MLQVQLNREDMSRRSVFMWISVCACVYMCGYIYASKEVKKT